MTIHHATHCPVMQAFIAKYNELVNHQGSQELIDLTWHEMQEHWNTCEECERED